MSVFETGDWFSPNLVWRHGNWRTVISHFSTSYDEEQQQTQQQSRRANLWDGSDNIATYVTYDTETVHSNSLQNR